LRRRKSVLKILNTRNATRGRLRRHNYSNTRLDLASDLVLARRINSSNVNEWSASGHAPRASFQRWFPTRHKIKTLRRR